jgi:hypothetical protein
MAEMIISFVSMNRKNGDADSHDACSIKTAKTISSAIHARLTAIRII